MAEFKSIRDWTECMYDSQIIPCFARSCVSLCPGHMFPSYPDCRHFQGYHRYTLRGSQGYRADPGTWTPDGPENYDISKQKDLSFSQTAVFSSFHNQHPKPSAVFDTDLSYFNSLCQNIIPFCRDSANVCESWLQIHEGRGQVSVDL